MASPERAAHRKQRDDAPDGFFAWEAAGLRWLAQAEGGPQIAEVLAVEDTSITLRRIQPGPATVAAADDFGRSLAALHAAGAPAFGSPPPGMVGEGWIGRQRQLMQPTASWGEFFAAQRIRPFVRAAVDNGNLDAAGATVLDRVGDRLAAGEFDDDRPPARIHGDLWQGNVLFGIDGVVLIDPAAHGGHGQSDLAMLALFGCQGLQRISSAYAEAAGLPADWSSRTGLHQLHPLAVHAVSHGPSYAAELVRVARRYA